MVYLCFFIYILERRKLSGEEYERLVISQCEEVENMLNKVQEVQKHIIIIILLEKILIFIFFFRTLSKD